MHLSLIGPTASGKSELAMAVARRVGAEILSVDSMQVYRGMDIGTAKPSPAERAEVRHHLIDVAEPTEIYTTARFIKAASGVIHDAAARGARLIATGGTPLYFKALFEGMFEGPSADPTLRSRLVQMGNAELHRRLAAVDPASAQRIHINDTKRLIRALEVYELTGTPISQLQRQWEAGRQQHAAVWVGLMWDRVALNRRINSRVKQMMQAGWVQEVRDLLDRYGGLSHTATEATGYAELIEHLAGRISLDDAVERIKIATRQLARRQMKWFRRFERVLWLEGSAPLEENVRRAIEAWGL